MGSRIHLRVLHAFAPNGRKSNFARRIAVFLSARICETMKVQPSGALACAFVS